ncbi:hypothetical protein ASESINO_34 [Erwinia phage vB_EamM_Asesino]|uniref:SH3 fold domain-containing protein n=1 Tax=Erwinia phage vB_EamM_Asesino TaxID=1883370 RepID=A0A1B2I9V3_9CAUD|nr:hypothetical protein ASESINO_34 [Erwinia phage vB_EamM_Asesino]ANZ48047.1 hypothetical protein ASESINO_34 [Erwinia phage vB_EamM_Asesino]
MYDVKSIEPGSVINIVYDTPLKGNESRVLVLASNVGFDLAKTYMDVRAEQKNIYSSLVAQPDDDPTKYTYLLFKGADGKPTVAADAWIRNVAIVQTIQVQFKVTLDNKQEIDDLKLALAARGFNDVKFEIIENVAG